MKMTMTFHLPEDQFKLQCAQKGVAYRAVIDNTMEKLRTNPSPETLKEISQTLHETLNDGLRDFEQMVLRRKQN